jgi:hypothetical protein
MLAYLLLEIEEKICKLIRGMLVKKLLMQLKKFNERLIKRDKQKTQDGHGLIFRDGGRNMQQVFE